MADQWHLLQDGVQYGPYSGEQLVEFAKTGRIVRESMVWAEGMAEWVPASAVEGLFPAAVQLTQAHMLPLPSRVGGSGVGAQPFGRPSPHMGAPGHAPGVPHAGHGGHPLVVTQAPGIVVPLAFLIGGLLLIGGAVFAYYRITDTELKQSQQVMACVLAGVGLVCAVGGMIRMFVNMSRAKRFQRYYR